MCERVLIQHRAQQLRLHCCFVPLSPAGLGEGAAVGDPYQRADGGRGWDGLGLWR